MPKLYSFEADLMQPPDSQHILPIVKESQISARLITLPDLHGNVLLAIYHLLVANFFKDQEVNKNSAYASLGFLYQELYRLTEQLKKEPYNRGLPILIQKKIKYFIHYLGLLNPTEQKIFLRYLGDVFSDRGVNDFLTFCFFCVQKIRNISYEILASNHDMILLAAFFANALNSNKPFQGFMANEFITSLDNMRLWIYHNIILEEEVRSAIKEAYLPYIKLLSYDYFLQQDVPKLILYSHAPIDFDVVKNICDFLKVTYEDDTMIKFCHTIDLLNKVFSDKLIAGDINKRLEYENAIFGELAKKYAELQFKKEIAKKDLIAILRETLMIYISAASTKWIVNTQKEIESELLFLLDEQGEFFSGKVEKLLSDFKKQNDLFLNPLIPILEIIYHRYHEVFTCYSAMRDATDRIYCKQTPLWTVLWSRVDRVVVQRTQQKRFQIKLENGAIVETFSSYYWSKSGWKKNALNVHGHAGHEHVMRQARWDGANVADSFYCNTDQSLLGKGIGLTRGTLFQYLSTSRSHEALERQPSTTPQTPS